MTRTYHECFRWWPPHPAEAIEWGTSFAAVWGSTPWGATAWENGFEIAFSLDCSTLGQAQMEVSDGWVVYLLLCKCYQRPTTTSRLYRYVARTFRRCAACSSSHVLYHQRPDAFWLTAVQRAMDIRHRALSSRRPPSHRSQGRLQQALFARSGSGSTRCHCSFYEWSERHDVQQRLLGLLLAFKVSARGVAGILVERSRALIKPFE
jgi:hypothetical protein